MQTIYEIREISNGWAVCDGTNRDAVMEQAGEFFSARMHNDGTYGAQEIDCELVYEVRENDQWVEKIEPVTIRAFGRKTFCPHSQYGTLNSVMQGVR